MEFISPSFPEVPLAKPCASYTGLTWWLHMGKQGIVPAQKELKGETAPH